MTLENSPHRWRTGTGIAAGTCGELVQGFTSTGEPFHVTCPIEKATTVVVRVRPAADFTITHFDPKLNRRVDPKLNKLARSLLATAALLELEPVEIRVKRQTGLDVGKGMGSSTADIVAAARALATAAGRPLSAAELAEIATSIESSDGSMYPGIVAFNQKNGHVLEEFSWWPRFKIVMITPAQVRDTDSAVFTGKEQLGGQFDELLHQLRAAVVSRDARSFAQAATQSAGLNQKFVPNPHYPVFADRFAELGALGLNVGHTGTLLGLLFDADDLTADGAASAARLEIQRMLPASANVEITVTPPSPGGRWGDGLRETGPGAADQRGAATG